MAFKTQSKKQLRKQAKNARKAAGKQVAAREEAVRNLWENQELHEDLRQLADAAKNAYARVASNGPQALLQDKKVHSELRNASDAAVGARKALSKPAKKKKKRGGFFRLLLLGTVGAAAAVATVPALRSKALDVVFGPEEELDYSNSAPVGTPSANGSAAAAADAAAASASKN